MVTGFCDNIAINVLIDTGASVSLISTRMVEQLDIISNTTPTSIKVAGLSKKLLPMRGEIKLPISISNTQIEHKFVVCDLITEDILAGNDVLEKIGAQIDFTNCVFYTTFGSQNFLTKPNKLIKRYKVKCHKTVTIPANSVHHFHGKINLNKRLQNYEGVIFGDKKLAEATGLCVENALAYSNENIVPIRYINPLPYEVTVTKNRIVAFMEPLENGMSIRGVHRVTENNEYDATIDLERLPDAEPEEVTREEGKWEDLDRLYEELRVNDVDLQPHLKGKLKELLAEFSHCFSRDKHDLGRASFYEACLNLKRDYVAKWIPSREIPYRLKPHMDKEISKLMESGQIERCKHSYWNSRVFCVLKPDGKSLRMVQYMRQLNLQTLPDNFELPKINTIMDKMSECEYLTSFDFTKGFNQIRPITAFTYDGNRHQWATMVMGQRSYSSSFARCMSQLFYKVPFQALICFLDDVLIGANTAEEHIKRLRYVLSRLSWGNLKISTGKTQLMKKEVRFLGQLISKEGLRIDPNRKDAILKLQAPKTVKQLQNALNYNRSYIKDFGKISIPLYKLLQKKARFNWDEACQQAFEDLKTAITEAQTMAIPQFDDPHNSYVLVIDSSKKAHGAVLTQLINGERRVISYFSKAVSQHMQKLGATRLEFLGSQCWQAHRGPLFFTLFSFRLIRSRSTGSI